MGCAKSRVGNKNETNNQSSAVWELKEQDSETCTVNFDENFTMDKDVDNIVVKLSDACSWLNKYTLVANYNFVNEVERLLHQVMIVLSRLGENGEHSKAERVVNATMRLRSGWNETIFRNLKLRGFDREEINRAKYCIVARQYFLVTPLNDDYTTIVVYSFTVRELNSDRSPYQYHLLYHDLPEDYFLVLVTTKGRLQLWHYADHCPTYWKVRDDVLRHLADRQDLANLAASLQLT